MDPVVVARALVVVVLANAVAAVAVAAVAPTRGRGGADADDVEDDADADADDEVDSQGILQSPGLVLGGDGDLDVFIMSLPGSGAGRGGCEYVTPNCGSVTHSVPICSTGLDEGAVPGAGGGARGCGGGSPRLRTCCW